MGDHVRARRHRLRVATVVARLTAVGASRERPLGHGAWVLQDPAGNRFCVIYPEAPGWPLGTGMVARPTPTGP